MYNSKNRYFITYSDLNYQHAGSKAKRDITQILESLGYSPIKLPKTQEWSNRLLGVLGICTIGIIRFLKLFFSMPSNSLIVMNHPFDFVSMNFVLPRMVAKNVVILVNHDINFCRFEDDAIQNKRESTEKHKKIYNLVSNSIVPAPSISTMERIGVNPSSISPLRIFPYLLDSSKVKSRAFCCSITFTGNFEKSEFINDWLAMKRSYSIELIGLHGENLKVGNNAIYKGAFDADVVPFKIDSSFGLVWDGNSIESCKGNYGNYLRYNCPHKLSLYLAIGIPVFIWREAGMAGFVEENKVGFLIDSLSDIDKILADMTEEKYKEMQENIKPIQRKITDGSYLVEALDDVISRI